MGHSKYPIKHWSYSSLLSFLRNPLAWHKRYVDGVYDTPSSPSGVIGRAAHVALQHYYSGFKIEEAVEMGLANLRSVPDFEIEFGKHTSKRAKKERRQNMEKELVQAVKFYLERPPRYKKIVGVEVSSICKLDSIPLPIKAISDLVVVSSANPNSLDIVDHKFVDSFSGLAGDKPLFVLQALFNYYTVRELYKKPVNRFIIQECKKRKNNDGSQQLRRYVLSYKDMEDDFVVFHRLLKDATEEIRRTRHYLPNPSDMFEGKNSFEIYRQGLIG